nr:hypothetical protein [Tanacetum cinerariifolium]
MATLSSIQLNLTRLGKQEVEKDVVMEKKFREVCLKIIEAYKNRRKGIHELKKRTGDPFAEVAVRMLKKVQDRDSARIMRCKRLEDDDEVGNLAIEPSEGLAECKASVSNLRRIQVKDIIKEVKDYLKTYLSAGIDISCQMSQSAGLYKFACKLDSLSSLLVQGMATGKKKPITRRGGSHVTNVPEFDKKDFTSWKVRFLVFLDGLEPYLMKTLECGPFVPLSNLSTSINPLTHEGPSDTRDTKIVALRLKFNAFKALEGEKDNDSDFEEDLRGSSEFIADLNAVYHERALLANQK